ncbi:MAG: amidohydrolase [Sporolactobacillus sp.]
MTLVEEFEQLIDEKRTVYAELAKKVWEHPELRFTEKKSSAYLREALQQEGFDVKTGIAGLQTGFVGSYGQGEPVVAFLGEFDALAGLSQKGGCAEPRALEDGGNGHGCGHNLLGVGSLAAAFAVKAYLEKHRLPGTVRFYGCPAEESGNGKAYMARSGCFKDVDAAFSWHPGTVNCVQHCSSNAVIEARFIFDGRSAHAAALPEFGRSALDAAELMNIGVNYLREHIGDQERVHYAMTNTGGVSPNVVQAHAEEVFLVRSPQAEDVRELFKRVVHVAEGAALMTDTTMSYHIEGGCYNLMPNTALHKVMQKYLEAFSFPDISEKDRRFIQQIYETNDAQAKAWTLRSLSAAQKQQLEETAIAKWVKPMPEHETFMKGSTDVSDVSWNVPTAQCYTATWAFATVPHTWQVVAQGTEDFSLDATLYAAKAMACTAAEALSDAALLATAKAEFEQRLDGKAYNCLIPDEIVPPVFN